MNIIKKMLMDSALTTNTIHEKVLRYTNESTKQNKRRLISMTNKIISVL